MIAQAPPQSFRDLVRLVAGDFRRCFAALLAFDVLFKFLATLIFLPLLAGLLFHLLRATGRTAVTNTDILGFLLSPRGVLYGFLFGLKLLGVALLEHAGMIALVALKQTGRWHGLGNAFIVLASRTARVIRLAALLLALAAVTMAHFAVLLALTYSFLLGGQDINYYLAARPPRFYVACALGVLWSLSALAVAAYLYTRWAFALPIVLLEDRQPIPALAVSAGRVYGAKKRIGAVLLGWQAVSFVLHVAGLAVFKLLAVGLLASAGSRPSVVVPLVVSLLIGQGLVLGALSFIAVAVHCLLLLRLYVDRSISLGLLSHDAWHTLDVEPAQPRKLLVRLEWGAVGLVAAAGVAYLALTLPFDLRDNVQVTAHRGYSHKAPENTLSAIREAIEAKADWVEIDVQETRDGEVILLHDNDLKRMTGDPRRPGQVTLKELKTLEARGKFGKEFADERIPTLREVIALARGKIKINVELKFPKKDHRLARKVADLLREEQFEDECFVASLDYPGVVLAKKHNPRLRTAAIISAALGDVSKLDVDILSVNAKLVDEKLLRTARRLGKEVHVWTVNDRRAMRKWIEHGVDNIITDDPERFQEVLRERADLGDTQRMLLACRYLLD
jgi:glycerophosphoryl diester phosphodiesterase